MELSGAATSAADDAQGGAPVPTIDWGADLEGAGEGAPAIQWDLDEADLVVEEGGGDVGDPAPLGTSAEGAAPLEVKWDIGVCSRGLSPSLLSRWLTAGSLEISPRGNGTTCGGKSAIPQVVMNWS